MSDALKQHGDWTSTLAVDFNCGPDGLFEVLGPGDAVWLTDGEMRCRGWVKSWYEGKGDRGAVVIEVRGDYSTIEDLDEDGKWQPRWTGLLDDESSS